MGTVIIEQLHATGRTSASSCRSVRRPWRPSVRSSAHSSRTNFFWALLLLETGPKRPITSVLNNLQGEFFTNYNILAAAALMVAIPTIIVCIALQRHFIRGLTLGSTKG
jgi:hypothetical protein